MHEGPFIHTSINLLMEYANMSIFKHGGTQFIILVITEIKSLKLELQKPICNKVKLDGPFE